MLSRRKFLKTAAASTAAPLILSSTNRAFAANERLAIGFIGVGTQGRGHLGSYLGKQNVEVVAVCDVVKERLDKASEMCAAKYADRIKSGTFSGAKAYTDFRELLAHKGLDAVVIATPDHMHSVPAILAARAGKHIYCEKPLTQNLADGRAIVNEVAKAKVIFQTGSQQRSEFGGHFRKAVEYVWNGRIGKLERIRIGVGGPARPCDLKTEEIPAGTDWDAWQGPAPERGYSSVLCPKGVHAGFPQWRAYQEYAGGQLADMGAHHFDIAQWAMKMDGSGPVEIVPPADPKKGKGLKFIYASGIEMIHDEFVKGTDGKEIKADCVFEGTDGIILVSRGGISCLPDTILKQPLTDKDAKVYPSNNHHNNWLDCIKSGKETICTAEIGQRSASICHLGNIGYRLGRKLKWDAATELFVGDEAANKELSREPRKGWKV
jgi:predicted dehydrogenase